MNVYSQEPSPTPREVSQNWQDCTTNTDKNGNTLQHCTQKKPLLIETTDCKGTNPNTNKQAQDIDQNSSTKDFINIVSILLTAVATVAMAIFTYWLVHYNKKMWETTIRSVHATEKAAKAAQKSVDALTCAERAYVLVDVSPVEGMIPFNTPISDFGIPVMVSNVGRTPAILTKIYIDAIWVEVYPCKYPELPYQFPPGGAVLTAGEKQPYNIPVHVPKDILNKIILSELKLVCYGLIEYQDVWNDKHENGFCWEIIPYRDATRGYIVVSKSTLINDSPLNKYT